MSAPTQTASEVAERLEAEARFPNLQRAGVCDDLRAAASLIRAQSERERVLVDALEAISDHSRDISGAPEMVKIARAALTKAQP